MPNSRNHRTMYLLVLLTTFLAASGGKAETQECRQMVLEGQVSVGGGWKASIGEGWVFRVVAIPPLGSGYSGWDLVVDRERPAGFPDALYLGTPPYQSINEREIGTTYGLRAQDAVGWNPRTFRFVTDPSAFQEAQKIYRTLADRNHSAGLEEDRQAVSRLLELSRHASVGEFLILDARLVPGTADPAPFAQQWARAASRAGYQVESASPGQSSPRGALRWMRFRIILRFPAGWKVPPGQSAVSRPCGR